MKSFLTYINEDVMPFALAANGSIDIKRDAVRDNINGILAGIVSCANVTPYTGLIKIRKALAMFGIQLPKRTYMEGKHGVEVWEIHQFGDKMGMNDQGEFIKSVPCEYYLFFHYHLIGSMYMLRAKIVDTVELSKELDVAESMIKEDAESQQKRAKVIAPKEDQHTALGDCDCSQGDSPSTKKAVDASMRRKDKKLSADKLDEVSLGKLVRYKNKADDEYDNAKFIKGLTHSDSSVSDNVKKHYSKKVEKREKGIALADKKMKGKAKVNASAPKHPYMEETVEEGRMPASVIRHKQKLANMTPEEKAKKFAGKSEEELKSMARRHGYGPDSNEYSKHGSFEKKLDEKLTKGMSAADVIHDFVHSDDPKFKGKSTKERQKMALGAYYGMHPEKSRKE